MASPVHQVFAITELLEEILLQLNSPTAIVDIQQVCRTWRNTVQYSIRLQRACWYKAHNCQPDQDSRGNEVWKLNPVFRYFGFPILTPLEGPPGAEGTLISNIYYDDWPHSYLPNKRRQRATVFMHPVGSMRKSWGDMLATQPPCRWMVLRNFQRLDHSPALVYARHLKGDGLLVSDVMAILTHYLRHRDRVLRDPFSSLDFHPVLEREIPDHVLRGIVRQHEPNASIVVGWHGRLRRSFRAVSLYRMESEASSSTGSRSGGRRWEYNAIRYEK